MIIVDTDIFIDMFRGVKAAKEFIDNQDEVCFSAVTEVELISGKECDIDEKRQKIIQILSFSRKIAVDNPIALAAGDIRRKHGLSPTDAIIAATAINERAPLATRNVKQFGRVAGLKVIAPY